MKTGLFGYMSFREVSWPGSGITGEFHENYLFLELEYKSIIIKQAKTDKIYGCTIPHEKVVRCNGELAYNKSPSEKPTKPTHIQYASYIPEPSSFMITPAVGTNL